MRKRTSRSKDSAEFRNKIVVVSDPLVDVSNVDDVEGVLRPRKREVDVDELEGAVSETTRRRRDQHSLPPAGGELKGTRLLTQVHRFHFFERGRCRYLGRSRRETGRAKLETK